MTIEQLKNIKCGNLKYEKFGYRYELRWRRGQNKIHFQFTQKLAGTAITTEGIQDIEDFQKTVNEFMEGAMVKILEKLENSSYQQNEKKNGKSI